MKLIKNFVEKGVIFGVNFKKYRKMRGISQKEFARLLFNATGKSLTLTSVSNYETGLHLPPPQVLPDIANILRVSIDALFGKEAIEETAEEEVAEAKTAGPDVVKECQQELAQLEQGFTYWKTARGTDLLKGTVVGVTMDYADKVAELAKKQQQELMILQAELAAIKEMLSIFRK